MKYELLYYELKEVKFTKRKTLQKFLDKLTCDQKLRLLKKDGNVYIALRKDNFGNFILE